MTRSKRGCLVALLVLALLAGAVVMGIALFLPGDLKLGAVAPVATPAPVVTTSVPAAPPLPVAPTPSAPALPAAAPGAWMTYLIPQDILQSEMRKGFPIDQNVVDLVRLQLDRPTFIADPDGAFLRLRLDVEARLLEGSERLPGSAVVRTQLSYDRGARAVKLRNAQLVELNFTGDAGRAAAALQPVLAAGLAAEMEGYVIYQVPAEGLWWLKTGVGFVRDVFVSDGRVAIALGP